MKLRKLKELFDKEFGFPFLPADAVRSSLEEDGSLTLNICGRSVRFADNGEILSEGVSSEWASRELPKGGEE